MEKKIRLTDIYIEFHVSDFEKVRDFYSKLGFEKVWEYPPKAQTGYLVMKRDSSILAFYCGNDEVYNHPYFKKFPKTTVNGYGVEVVIHITNRSIEDYYKEVITKIDKEAMVQSLESKPWGNKDFRLVDPFGYYLCFREDENILEP